MQLLLGSVIPAMSLRQFRKTKSFVEVQVVTDDKSNENLFVSVPFARYQELLKKEVEQELLSKGYKDIVNELFPQDADHFGRELHHDRIIQEVKSMRTIHARSSRLNLLLGEVKRNARNLKYNIDSIIKSCEEF